MAGRMAALLYLCPTSGLHVQRWFANAVAEASKGDQYETVA
jgi:hypothetical protein